MGFVECLSLIQTPFLVTASQTPPADEAVFPVAHGHSSPNLISQIQRNITTLIDRQNSNDGDSTSKCQTCILALKQGQKLARADPKKIPGTLVELCTKYQYLKPRDGLTVAEACSRTYAAQTLGAQYAQILSYADLKGDNPSDGQYICSYVVGASRGCSAPKPVDLHADGYLDKWFGGKQKRDELRSRSADIHSRRVGPAFMNKRGEKSDMRVLHFSDIHVDPRFFVGSEGGCTSGQCCRSTSYNSSLAQGAPSSEGTLLPAANLSDAAIYWGNYRCDAPWSLALAAMESVTALNHNKPVDMSLYTGDMVTHDSTYHLSDALVRYTQQAIFDTMKKYLGHGPVFSAIGNHDTAPSDSAAPRALPDKGPRDEFSYDWNNLRRLFEAEGWFSHKEGKQVAKHYGGYSVSPRKGLRIITLNTDFWYKGNVYNFINSSNPDASGTLRFLTDELEAAHNRKERVWIVGHVLTGWDGTNPLPNPTNLFYQIVDHYSPRTIAHIFFGHTHEDQFNVFFGNNATERTTKHAKAVSFMAPSVTPGTNVNPALRLYTVDPETYEVMDYDQYYTQVPDFRGVLETGHGPEWKLLYSARGTYGNFSASATVRDGGEATVGNGTVPVQRNKTWPASAPLNATFWSAVTDEMTARPSLVSDVFHVFQGRNSSKTAACNASCVAASICYMRSGSAPLGQLCPQGFGSVQGG